MLSYEQINEIYDVLDCYEMNYTFNRTSGINDVANDVKNNRISKIVYKFNNKPNDSFNKYELQISIDSDKNINFKLIHLTYKKVLTEIDTKQNRIYNVIPASLNDRFAKVCKILEEYLP